MEASSKPIFLAVWRRKWQNKIVVLANLWNLLTLVTTVYQMELSLWEIVKATATTTMTVMYVNANG